MIQRSGCLFLVFVFFSLQEVKATPIKFMSDLIYEDSWSHLFMNTLAPKGFVKVGITQCYKIRIFKFDLKLKLTMQ